MSGKGSGPRDLERDELPPDPWATAEGFLAERYDFLQVRLVPGPYGDGYDVVLRLDGTYYLRAMAEEMVPYFRKEVARLVTQARAVGRE